MDGLTSRFLGHPLVICLVGVALCCLLGLFVKRWPVRILLPAAVLLITAIFLFTCGTYLLSPVWVDHVEAGVACVSCLFARGAELYHPFQNAERYALVYGPNLFLVNAGAVHLLGASTFAIKLPGVIFALLSLVLVFDAARRAAGWLPACAAATYYCSVCLLLSAADLSFCDRSEPQLFFWIALGAWACVQRWGLGAGVLLGLSLGLALNLKFNMIAFFLPLLVLLWQKQGWRAVWAAAAAAVVVAVLPFVLFDTISFRSYLTWIREYAGRSLEWRGALHTVEWSLYFITPPALAALAWRRLRPDEFALAVRRHLWFIVACLLTAIAVLPVGSAVGPGHHHVAPFAPVLALVLAVVLGKVLRSQSQDRGRLKWLALVGLGVGAAILWTGGRTASVTCREIWKQQDRASAIIADIHDVEKRYPNRTVGMGYGDNLKTYDTAFYRTELLYAGQPHLLEPAAMMDMALVGLEIPAATRQVMRDGQFAIWLIPKGEQPFGLPSFHQQPGHKLEIFDAAFRQEFAQDYQLRDHSQFFDLWVYRNAK